MSASPRDVCAYPSVIEAIELPRLIRLGGNLYGACFTLMKLLPARFMLDRARDAGLLRAGGHVVETSSGTFGLALALLCNRRGYRLTLVSDPAIDPPFERRLCDLGARVEIVREPAPVGGLQGARLERLERLRAELPGHFWPCQYDNPHNPGAYAPVSELLADALGEVSCLVGTVGSGGSTSGVAHYLRAVSPRLRSVGVDTLGSVLFGQPDAKRLLRGLGNSLMPRNVDHASYDEVHWVSAAEGFAATRALHREHALFMGPTSGAAYLVAKWCAAQRPDETVVALLPDEGHRYQDTVYDDEWLRQQGVFLDRTPDAPRPVDRPEGAGPGWSRLAWDRRTYEQVMAAPFNPQLRRAPP